MGERLEVIDWQGIEIVPVQKDFSFEHPEVAGRSEEECERIRASHSIHVVANHSSEPLPKPFVHLHEAPFPDWAAAELRNMGFLQPTSIQVQAWPVLLKGCDFVGIAETGSGKTIAYVLPMLVHLMAQPELRPGEGPVALVVVPTRDLCIQVSKQVTQFVGRTGIVCRALYGGEDITAQARALAQRMDIAVATPGRLITLLNSRVTNLRRATFVVLDEADELLGRGFGEQVRLVLTQIRPDRQVLMFSATWHKVVDELAREACSQKPVHLHVGSTKLSACKAIRQRLRKVESGDDKVGLLCEALGPIRSRMANDHRARALVFCNNRASVDPLVEDLRQRGYPCRGFHGHQPQDQRDEALQQFASPDLGLWLLVCTQILGRGYDFTNVKYVINFDMPPKIVEYIHRIGRTGRAGQQGFSLTFITDSDLMMARDLVMVLRESGQEVPPWLQQARWRGRGGYGGYGGGRGDRGDRGYRCDRDPHGHQWRYHGHEGQQHARGDGGGWDPASGSTGSAGGPAGAAGGGGGGGFGPSPQPPPQRGPMRGNHASHPPQDPRRRESDVWCGRGRDRRAYFLAECAGKGVSRAAPPDEPVVEFFES